MPVFSYGHFDVGEQNSIGASQWASDAVWGVGRDGRGGNLLGKLLMELRDELGQSP